MWNVGLHLNVCFAVYHFTVAGRSVIRSCFCLHEAALAKHQLQRVYSCTRGSNSVLAPAWIKNSRTHLSLSFAVNKPSFVLLGKPHAIH